MRLRRRLPLPLPLQPDCHDVEAVLQAYLDGELGPADAEVVATHLAHCQRCQIEAATVERVIETIRQQRPDIDPEPIERLAGYFDRLTRNGPPEPFA